MQLNPDDINDFQGCWFKLAYMQKVCRMKRYAEFVNPVRLDGAVWCQGRLLLIFDAGKGSTVQFGVDWADLRKLVPVVSEAKK